MPLPNAGNKYRGEVFMLPQMICMELADGERFPVEVESLLLSSVLPEGSGGGFAGLNAVQGSVVPLVDLATEHNLAWVVVHLLALLASFFLLSLWAWPQRTKEVILEKKHKVNP